MSALRDLDLQIEGAYEKALDKHARHPSRVINPMFLNEQLNASLQAK